MSSHHSNALKKEWTKDDGQISGEYQWIIIKDSFKLVIQLYHRHQYIFKQRFLL